MKKALLIVAILSIGVAAAVLLKSTAKPPEKKEVERLAPLVDVLALNAEAVTFEIPSRGTVTPLINTQLSAEVSGSIVSVSPNFIAGGIFRAGETLAQIDPVVFQAALNRAKATLKQREIEYEGIKKLGTKGYRSETELAAAEAALAAAKADLADAKRNLDKTRIRAPFSGMVREKSVDLGQFVSPGTPLGRVFGTEVAEVRLPLSERELRFVRLPEANTLVNGVTVEPVKVTLTGSYRGKPASWRAEIVRTEGVVDDQNRVTFAVARVNDPYALADDAAGRAPLPIGTFANAGIAGITVNDVIRVPQAAVRGNNQLLMVDDENKLRIREADIIRIDERFAYVLAESLPETKLVMTAIEAPLNGLAVRTQADIDETGDDDQLAASDTEKSP
ncbi:MAG: efflux RND transporter periplasmic adaptor subunit [Pseudomonadota bacterium]